MLSEITITRPKLVPYQKAILESPARFTVTTAATKIGKTFSHLWWLFEKAHTPPKNGANYWWVAPVYSQAKIAFNRLKRVCAPSGIYKINESELYIETPAGARISFKSAEKPDNLYGEDVFAAVFDEFPRAKEEAWHALRSTLTHTQGECKFIGNPKGRKNWGYRLAHKAQSGDPEYQFFRVTAYDAIEAGILDPREVEQAKRDLPKYVFDELFLAEDLEDGGNPFGYSFIEQYTRPLSDSSPVCYGVDLAKRHDWTVVVGLDENGQICYFDRWQSDWGQTRRRIIATIGSTPAFIDSTGVGDPIVEDVQKECGAVEGYWFTSKSKQKLMEGLASGLQQGKTSVLEGIMKLEMEAFEYNYTKNGVTYSAPEDCHDDTVCALALAFMKYSEGSFNTFVHHTGFF